MESLQSVFVVKYATYTHTQGRDCYIFGVLICMNILYFYHSTSFDEEPAAQTEVQRAHGSFRLRIRELKYHLPREFLHNTHTPTGTEQQHSNNKPTEPSGEDDNQSQAIAVPLVPDAVVTRQDHAVESSVDPLNQTCSQDDDGSPVDPPAKILFGNEVLCSSKSKEPSCEEAASQNNWENPLNPPECETIKFDDSQLQNPSVFDTVSQNVKNGYYVGQNSNEAQCNKLYLPKPYLSKVTTKAYIQEYENGRQASVYSEKLALPLSDCKQGKLALYHSPPTPNLQSSTVNVHLNFIVESKSKGGVYDPILASSQCASGGERGGLSRQLQDVDGCSSGTFSLNGHSNADDSEGDEYHRESDQEEGSAEENQKLQRGTHHSQPETVGSSPFPTPTQEKCYYPDSSCPVFCSLSPGTSSSLRREREPPDLEEEFETDSHFIVASSYTFPSQLPYGFSSTYQPSGLVSMKKLPHQELALITFGAQSVEMLSPDVRLEYSLQADSVLINQLLTPQQVLSSSQTMLPGIWKFEQVNCTQAIPLNHGCFPWLEGFNTYVELEPD